MPPGRLIGKVSHVELRDQQSLWQGFGNGLGQAVEMVLTPVLLGLFGAWLDQLFGTSPVLMLVFGVVGVLGMAARTYYWYQAKIAAEEERKPWKRSQR